jgi:hypothetical protein
LEVREEPLSVGEESRELEEICGRGKQQGLEIEAGGRRREF